MLPNHRMQATGSASLRSARPRLMRNVRRHLWHHVMKVPGIRSSYEKVGGIVYFGRMLDKIRLHAAGQLPDGYNLGTKVWTWFDEISGGVLNFRS